MTRLPTITSRALSGAEIAMRQHTMNTLELVIDLPFLAREVKDAHRQVLFHGKSMLMEAKRAGEALLAAKEALKAERKAYVGPEQGAPPVFVDWVKTNTGVAYSTAASYMRVANLSKVLDLQNFSGGLRAFLDAHTEQPATEPSAPREFTREDAERALKFHALATRGATDAEKEAASGKLISFAQEFGMSPDALVAKAFELLPAHEKTDAEQSFEEQVEAVNRRNAEREERTRAAEKRVEELE
ncbi:hypothetical protein [Ancylobacter moscoviensis]